MWTVSAADGLQRQSAVLCGSCNQDVVFFSDRYSQQDLQPQGYEVTISENGATAIITGFPPAD